MLGQFSWINLCSTSAELPVANAGERFVETVGVRTSVVDGRASVEVDGKNQCEESGGFFEWGTILAQINLVNNKNVFIDLSPDPGNLKDHAVAGVLEISWNPPLETYFYVFNGISTHDVTTSLDRIILSTEPWKAPYVSSRSTNCFWHTRSRRSSPCDRKR